MSLNLIREKISKLLVRSARFEMSFAVIELIIQRNEREPFELIFRRVIFMAVCGT
jgi:hypothetical protein